MKKWFLFVSIFIVTLNLNIEAQNDSVRIKKLRYGILLEGLGAGLLGSINGIVSYELKKNYSLFFRAGGIKFQPTNLNKFNPPGNTLPNIISIPIYFGVDYGRKKYLSVFCGVTYWSGNNGDEKRTTNQKTLETEPNKRYYLTSLYWNVGLQYSINLGKHFCFGVGLVYLKYFFELNEKNLGKYKFYPELAKNEKQKRYSYKLLWPQINVAIKF